VNFDDIKNSCTGVSRTGFLTTNEAEQKKFYDTEIERMNKLYSSIENYIGLAVSEEE